MPSSELAENKKHSRAGASSKIIFCYPNVFLVKVFEHSAIMKKIGRNNFQLFCSLIMLAFRVEEKEKRREREASKNILGLNCYL